MQAQEPQKKPKTWDEAINELRGFIIQSKKEEQMKSAAEKEKAETQKEQQV